MQSTLRQSSIAKGKLAVHALGKVRIVGGDEGGDVFGADQAQEFCEDDVRRCDVEVAGGFVGEQDGGFVGQSAGNGDALLLPAGEFAGEVACPGGEAERVKQVNGAFFGVVLGFAGNHLREDDVFQGGEFGK